MRANRLHLHLPAGGSSALEVHQNSVHFCTCAPHGLSTRSGPRRSLVTHSDGGSFRRSHQAASWPDPGDASRQGQRARQTLSGTVARRAVAVLRRHSCRVQGAALHYNWKYSFLRPTVKEIIERYNKKFRPTVHAKLVASAASVAAAAAASAASASAAGSSSDPPAAAQ